jgi:2-phosphosulfolactate phosphatase
MKIDVILTPPELPSLKQRDLSNTVCIVFDILRATSTFVTALHHGANAIIPVCEIAEALDIRKNQPDVLLGGERDGVKIRAAQTGRIDFDFGNSPRECTPEKVQGRMIVSTTTNGTRALRACVGAQTILAGSFLNLGATAEFIKKLQPAEVLLVCAGTGENRADEDVLAAGALCEFLARDNVQVNFSDSAEAARRAYTLVKSDLTAAFSVSQNGRRLLAIPELRDDVAFCSQRDIFPLIAKMEADGAIRVGRS